MDHQTGDKAPAIWQSETKDNAREELSQEVFGSLMKDEKNGGGGRAILPAFKEILKDLDKDNVPSWIMKGGKVLEKSGQILEDLEKDTVPPMMKGGQILEDLDKDTVPNWLEKGSKILEDLDKDIVPNLLFPGAKILKDLDKDKVPEISIMAPGPLKDSDGPRIPRYRPEKETRSFGIDRTPKL